MSKLRFAALYTVLSVMPGLALSQQPAGHVLWLFGEVQRIDADGAAKPLAKGDAVFEGDVIRSAPGSQAQLVMSDEALVAIRADSSVKLTKYSYAGREDGTERAIIELLKGGLRSVSGAIGRSHKENYQLKHQMHVIGIRGTDHEAFADETGTFSRVTMGGTYLQGPGGRMDLAPGEVAFLGKSAGSTPLRLERTPEFMHVAALRSATSGPAPRARGLSEERLLGKSPLSSALGLPGGSGSAVPPAQAVGENTLHKGWSKGGRCIGSCADPLKNNGKSATPK